MSNIDYVLEICSQITNHGKTPSMGLIKSYSKESLPIPMIVAALNRWKSLSKAEKTEWHTKNSKTLNTAPKQASIQTSENQRLFALEQEVASLRQDVKALSSLLKASNLK